MRRFVSWQGSSDTRPGSSCWPRSTRCPAPIPGTRTTHHPRGWSAARPAPTNTIAVTVPVAVITHEIPEGKSYGDIIDVFPESLDTRSGDLQLMGLSETPSLIVLFTQVIEQADTHYSNYPNLMGEFQCNASSGRRCILCDISIPLTHRRCCRPTTWWPPRSACSDLQFEPSLCPRASDRRRAAARWAHRADPRGDSVAQQV